MKIACVIISLFLLSCVSTNQEDIDYQNSRKVSEDRYYKLLLVNKLKEGECIHASLVFSEDDQVAGETLKVSRTVERSEEDGVFHEHIITKFSKCPKYEKVVTREELIGR